ncbi:MAG: protease modulator HflC [Gammaproteobacteria bacterium]|nr:protease modulator HflC [Gammaproteobacteria bacterium]MCW8839827.1 protease modulator HflC [Gammaproteobacteria bacterium]MCW8928328.1 protease modulator HflC [Gammaproteobacteria bacterium]MCW8959589.1 protease modulator HflC [Gammaproteobacteria bacterium]MCW8971831.1 protease modulator HflC [Gammaproteobacteria bacterium]
MSPVKTISLILAAAVVWLASMSFFVVDETELAIKFRLGEIVKTDYEPGLYFKLPFVNNVRKFDSRILTLDAQPERYLTFEKKNVIVDAFIKWRISDVANYYTTMAGSERNAGLRLSQVIKNGLRDEFGKRTIQEAISGERSQIMNVITAQIEDQANQFGIEVVDVRIKRIELPPEVSGSVYQRMEAERSRVAKDLRSRGAEAAERIRADADRQRTVILAEAYRDAEGLRGEGDARSAEVYASAFTQDAEFYELYRSLNAYKNVFRNEGDVLVLDPTSEFFKYFKNAKGLSQ